ncbi:MAG: IPT/TIG domain-containing protein [Bdellovibrionota bacterium]
MVQTVARKLQSSQIITSTMKPRRLLHLLALLLGYFTLTVLTTGSIAKATPLVVDPDTDLDGVSDGQEAIDQTSRTDSDSFIRHDQHEYCQNWNGNLTNLLQVMELRNAGCGSLSLQLSLRAQDGTVTNTLDASIDPGKESDVIINSITGFLPNTYGTICATIVNGDSDSLDTQMSTYALLPDSFDFGFAEQSSAAVAGPQYLGYNNFFPTFNFFEVTNFVEGYAQISSEADTDESGQLVYYDADGVEVKRVTATVKAHGRFDVDVHSVGQARVGLLEWLPDSATAKFRVVLNRYYHTGPNPTFPRKAVLAVTAKHPSGYRLSGPIDTRTGAIWLELSNSLNTSVNVDVEVFDAAGSLTSTQPPRVTLPAKGTSHLLLNNYLTSDLGRAQIDADQTGSIVSSLMEYRLDSSLRLLSASAGDLQAGFGKVQGGGYNNFLGSCILRLSNLTSSPQVAALSVKRGDGTSLPFASTANLPANATGTFDLCGAETNVGYGQLVVTPAAPETFTGDVIRTNRAGTASFRSSLRERAICTADIESSPSSLLLVAESNTPQALTIVNHSSAVTATNVQATLPASFSDVTQNSTECSTLNPLQTCHIYFTPGDTIHSAQSVQVQGSNTARVGASLSVVTPTQAKLSVSPSLFTLQATTGTPVTVSATITNTSSFATATNVTADISGAISGAGVTQSSSPCTLAPHQSCLLSLTPATTQLAQTAFHISGSNTPTINANVIVNAAPQAVLSPLTATTASVPTNSTVILQFQNTSTTENALNVGATLAGTALSGKLTETGNTCASVAPSGTCTLTYTAGNTLAVPTSVAIKGTNTNTITANFEIVPGITLSSVSPSSGPASGGVGVTLSGSGFTGTTSVTFGGVAATSVNVINDTTVTAVTPAHAIGAVDVVITNSTASDTKTNGYTSTTTSIGQSAFGGTIACLNGASANLIAAVADNSSAIDWGGIGVTTGATSTTDGATNTAAIVTSLGAGSYAAKLCNSYEVDSQGNSPCEAGNTCYNDWFLPSGNNTGASGQLNCLYTNAVAIGGFSTASYWSSTEFNNLTAQTQDFASGTELLATKSLALSVRCVRSFVP